MSQLFVARVHHNLHSKLSMSVLKSMIGSLNATAIAYTRGYLRFSPKDQTPSDDEVNHIDNYNDGMNAIEEVIQREQASRDMGFNTQMNTGELIQRLMAVRSYFVEEIAKLAQTKNDVPLSIAETIQFQADRQPDDNASFIEALAIAIEIDPQILKDANLQKNMDDARDLRENAGRIYAHLSQYDLASSNGDVKSNYTEAQFKKLPKDLRKKLEFAESMRGDQEFDIDAVDKNISELPKHVQYKLMFAAHRAYTKLESSTLTRLLRGGNLDAAVDFKLLKANRADIENQLRNFMRKHELELDAYVERGGQLPYLEDRSTLVGVSKPSVVPEPTRAAVNAEANQRLANSLSSLLGDKPIAAEPKVIGAPRRSPKVAA